MKRINKIASLAMLIFLVSFTSGRAQEKLRLGLGYNFNMPVGAFKDFISNTSYRGFHGELSYSINEQLNVGLGATYNDFYQKYPRQVYKSTDGDISAVVTNSIQTVPVLAQASYSFTKEGVVRPYIGLGAGFNLISYEQYLGEYPQSKAMIKPAVGGNAGINIPVGKRNALVNLGAAFNYLPFNYNDIKTLNNWGVHAGVSFPLR